MHAIEEIVVPPYLFAPTQQVQLRLADGRGVEKTCLRMVFIRPDGFIHPHNFSAWEQHYERAARYLDASGLRRGPLLAAEAFLIEAQALWEAALKALRDDPLCFVARAHSRR